MLIFLDVGCGSDSTTCDTDAAVDMTAEQDALSRPDSLAGEDGALPGLGCFEVLRCLLDCTPSNEICINGCMLQASSSASTSAQAYLDCAASARQGDCATECATLLGGSLCSACTNQHCRQTLAACTADFAGEQIEGFGAVCSTGGECLPPLTCMPLQEGEPGYCTLYCDEPTGSCPGTPQGVLASCIMSTTGAGDPFLCGFVCRLPGNTYDCPADLSCATEDTPPGSGQRLCTVP